MARKTTEQPKMPATETEPEMKAVRLYLPKDVHKLLRQLAADNETNMAIMARKIVVEHLTKTKGPKPKGATK